MKRLSIVATMLSLLLILFLMGCSSSKMADKSDGESSTKSGMTMDEEATKVAAEGSSAMDTMIKAYPKSVSFHKELSHWVLTTPQGEMLEWTSDMKLGKDDLSFSLLSDPLVKAGMDVKKLGAPWKYNAGSQDSSMKMAAVIEVKTDLGDTASNAANNASDGFKAISTIRKDMMDYHKETDNYALLLDKADKGYWVEWAKTAGTAKGDLVFVFPAEPLVKAGLDVKKLPSDYTFQAAKKDAMMGQLPDLILHKVSFK